MHRRDADCARAGTVDAATGDCSACGVTGCREAGVVEPPCYACKGERFHEVLCPEALVERRYTVQMALVRAVFVAAARRNAGSRKVRPARMRDLHRAWNRTRRVAGRAEARAS